MVNRKVRCIRNSTWVGDLPIRFVEKLGLTHRETVSVTYENDSIVIRKINAKEPSALVTKGSVVIYG